ncbi:MAG: phosphatidate cytidylyltransferase [Planctomycetes bacterium]|nr:phosphatidate cytidylyltransferase [Planctomycetota bacterium]
MIKRVIFGSAMVIGSAALLWWDYSLQQSGGPVGAPLAGMILVLLAVGTMEFARLAASVGLPVMRAPAVACVVGLAGMPLWRQLVAGLPAADAFLLAMPAVVIVIFFAQLACHRTDLALRRLAGTLLCVAYLGGLGACVLAMRVRFGLPSLVMFLAAVKFTDIGAYFTGSAIGRHKLIPWLSPGKSWEGLAGGLVAGTAVAMLLNWLLATGQWSIMNPGWCAVFGLALGAAGQFGDLCESLLKRDAQCKDSGAVVPEFGGILDIVDSPLVASPVGYALLLAFIQS